MQTEMMRFMKRRFSMLFGGFGKYNCLGLPSIINYDDDDDWCPPFKA